MEASPKEEHCGRSTTRSMSDDLYRRILDSLYDGVYLVDPDRRITYWNWGGASGSRPLL